MIIMSFCTARNAFCASQSPFLPPHFRNTPTSLTPHQLFQRAVLGNRGCLNEFEIIGFLQCEPFLVFDTLTSEWVPRLPSLEPQIPSHQQHPTALPETSPGSQWGKMLTFTETATLLCCFFDAVQYLNLFLYVQCVLCSGEDSPPSPPGNTYT